MRSQAKAVLVVAALCSFFLIAASSAFAGYGELGRFATNPLEQSGVGSQNGELFNTGQIDVNDATGNIYVADTGNNRVQVFKPNATGGEYDSQMAISEPVGLAIDQGSGDVYVSNASGISKFTASLTPAAGWTNPGVTGPLTVDPSTGDLLVADTAANLVRRFESDGTAAGTFPAARPIDLAANSSGEVFVVTSTGDMYSAPCGATSSVVRYTGAGTEVGVIGASLEKPGAVAIDPDDDSIFVAANVGQYFCENRFVPVELAFFDVDGSPGPATLILNANTHYAMVPGMTVQGDGSKRAYVATRSPINDIFGKTQVLFLEDLESPEATIGAADDIEPFSATLHAEVNPKGHATTCRFQYSTDLSFSQSVPCSTNPGDGTAFVSVQAAITGLATDTTYNFRVVATSYEGAAITPSSSASFTTAHADTPAVTLATPTAVTGTSAHLSGTVDPFDNPTTYRFEYKLAAAPAWSVVPGGAGSAGSGTGPVAKEAELAGLLPSTAYSVRLSATNGAGTKSTVPQDFATLLSAPLVQTLAAAQVSETSAVLKASVDPAGEATTYYFEWGLDTGYGSTLPTGGPANAGSGNGADLQAQQLKGLQPGTVYHYRVVAENGTGIATGDDQSFMTSTTPAACANEAVRERQGTQFLPDCRAYEMISPPRKKGVDVTDSHHRHYGVDFVPLISETGDASVFTSHGSFADAKGNPVVSFYQAIRSASGWSTKNVTPPVNGARQSSPLPVFQGATSDLMSWAISGAKEPQLLPQAAEGVENGYLWNSVSDTYRLLSPGLKFGTFAQVYFEGGSTDLERMAIDVYGGNPLAEGAPANVQSQLYEWNGATEALTLVGREPGTNDPFQGDVLIANPKRNVGAGTPAKEWNPVSDDGSKIYFYTPGPPEQELYVRVNGATTRHVSASQAAAPDPNGTKPAWFLFASQDGQTAFFSSAEKLTDDATTGPNSEGEDLYRYDLGSEELTDLTVSDSGGNGAEVVGAIGGSDSGDRFYFVARGELAPGAVAGDNNLYLWTDDGTAKGEITFVSRGLHPHNWAPHNLDPRHLGRVTPDGMHALFQSTERITSYDNDGHFEVYTYDVAADETTCVSCNPAGTAATADSLANGTGDLVQAARTLTDDGRYAFFNTVESLVPTDVNGRVDAYAYDAEHGRVDLISPGTGEFDAEFADATVDGGDVVFTTRQQLLTQDVDTNSDAYTAHVEGGFLSQSPPPSPAPCVGEACRPEPAVPPSPSGAASGVVNGKGNVKERKKQQQKKKSKHKKKKHKKKSKTQKKQGARR